EWRSRIQENQTGKKKLKCPSAKAFLKDRTNHLNHPPLELVPKLERVDRNKDVVRNVAKGAQRDGKLDAKSSHRAGHAAQQKPSITSQRAAAAHPELPRRSTELPMGLVLSRSHPTQPKGRLPASSSGHLNPERKETPAQETVTAAAHPPGIDLPPPGAPFSLNEGLQGRLVGNKKNIQAQASAHPLPSRPFQSDGKSLRNQRVFTQRQSSAMMSRTVTGPKDRINSHQAREEPIQDKFRKALPGSKSAPQNPSVKPQPLQPLKFSASTNSLHKMLGADQDKTRTARETTGRPLGTLPAGSLKHYSAPLQVKGPPIKLLASTRPQGTTKPKPSLKACGSMEWQRPTAKGEVDRKDTKVVPVRRTAASCVTVPQNQPRSAHGSKIQAIERDFRSRGEKLKPKLLKGNGIQAWRVPKTPSPADRKKQLEEWLASKGKTYKRPPMTLLQKKPVKLSLANVKEEEKEKTPERLCFKINDILTECLKLAEEGVETEEICAILSRVPQAEKFAKFWICKVKLFAQRGPLYMLELYKAAVCAGAEPLEELREVVLDLLKPANQKSEGEMVQQPAPCKPATPCPSEKQPAAVTPHPTGWSQSHLPVSVKLQVTSAARGKEMLEAPEMKFLTPVRRSLRIERAGSHYPEMLKDHDPVVSSLREVVLAEEDTQFVFRKNKALPEVAELG
ncbi:PREDICTED: cytoskeleton-associated protein 2-like, partial [Eurypyga helias]|uniref:cytoskeleton-associated protein 2-like n=1 Tax=Eurypyga helias TaxID=54383 RepID=UPI0005281AB4